ncbi:MAG: hypothetical protein ACO1QS_07900 [Verrucomicrobiota bacterium]
MNPASLAMRMKVSSLWREWQAMMVGMLVLMGMGTMPLQGALIDVELADLPVTDALNLVARQAGLELQVGEELERTGVRPDKLPWAPPSIQLKLKQVAADQVVESLAGAYGLVLDKSPGVSLLKLRFARSGELVFDRAGRLLPDPQKDQRKVGLLLFDEAPLMQVVQTLALQSRLNLIPSHELMVGTNTQGVAWQDVLITLKIRNVTPQQALEAALDAGGLVVDWSGLGQVGVIYPVQRFLPASRVVTVKPPVKEEKTDFTLADLALEDFVQLMGGQMEVNWVVSTAARQATTGAGKQPLLQSPVSISKTGITPLAALQEVLKSKGLEFRWNGRAGVGVIDVVK